MIPRRGGARDRHGLGSRGGETEALQTDVMRFMAILGLCLTAVFALVQGLPGGGAPAAPMLGREIASQRARAQALAAELKRLKAGITEARGQQDEARQVLSRLRERRERARAELDAFTRRLEGARRELVGIEQAFRDKDRDPGELSHRLQAQQVRLDRVERRLKELDTGEGEAAPETPAPAHPEPVPEEPGFTLRFASSEALDRLVAAGSVRFYAMAGGQAWQLSLPGNGAAFARAPLPGRFHEMAPSTVPSRYLRAFARTGKGLGVVWGVELPPGTEQLIASLTRGRRGGALVIHPDGRVALEADRAQE